MVFTCPSTTWRNIWCFFKQLLYFYHWSFFSKWPPSFQFWELMSKNEISRTISYIYFMKIMAASWFPETGPSLINNPYNKGLWLDFLKYLSFYCLNSVAVTLYFYTKEITLGWSKMLDNHFCLDRVREKSSWKTMHFY